MSNNPAEQMPVKINVKTIIQQDNDQETYELTTFGKHFHKDNDTYLQYEEAMEEGQIKTIVKIAGSDALILRSGAIKMRLALSRGQKRAGSYETPYGTFRTSATVKRLEHIVKDQACSGSLELLYDFFMENDKAGTYQMTITYEEEGQ
ncbi:DUF1934 domain-containing protein [Bacillus canaveralius]|uniref:DUF1934 domain-containing protein n=1 Tax=Bacillus canaveralius TaxID=1403243 RepID=A0A2N5GG94_9BACI|nr:MULTISPECIES: DUF1934 family protein [Bacillus]PLR79784.1 DUF1934 domain-containing protein [Bacillus canaveralius]PLR85511.1 DUF1934 domain-containing protein [Bacillus sp. V33-4]PLR94530.1 DUF1934 domain-containing protein [Bacillus canaveralius]RSK57535.1 DUF1934 family protein [Bacillus canaveralius]